MTTTTSPEDLRRQAIAITCDSAKDFANSLAKAVPDSATWIIKNPQAFATMCVANSNDFNSLALIEAARVRSVSIRSDHRREIRDQARHEGAAVVRKELAEEQCTTQLRCKRLLRELWCTRTDDNSEELIKDLWETCFSNESIEKD